MVTNINLSTRVLPPVEHWTIASAVDLWPCAGIQSHPPPSRTALLSLLSLSLSLTHTHMDRFGSLIHSHLQLVSKTMLRIYQKGMMMMMLSTRIAYHNHHSIDKWNPLDLCTLLCKIVWTTGVLLGSWVRFPHSLVA